VVVLVPLYSDAVSVTVLVGLYVYAYDVPSLLSTISGGTATAVAITVVELSVALAPGVSVSVMVKVVVTVWPRRPASPWV